MTERVLAPIMIGVTGKRNLLGKDEAVRSIFNSCFEHLDNHLTASRKLLLTGLASGADTIAAQAALDRGWKVIAVLPFALDIYAQDFDTAGADQLRRFADPQNGLLSDHAKGKVIVLDPLINPQTNLPFLAADLVREQNGSNPCRADHYEQVGLYIAERSALLTALMPAAEQPDRIGGTARIVEYRLHGTWDVTAERIIGHSQVLKKPVDLDSPQTGPLWLIDLDGADSTLDHPLRSVQLWQPGRHQINATEKIKWRRAEELIDRLRLANRINAFNALANEIENGQWQREVEARARRDEQWKSEVDDYKRLDRGDASSALRRIRLALSVIQGGKKQKLSWVIKALTLLFVLAVLMVESHIQFEQIYTIIPYIALLALVFIIFLHAQSRTLQQFSEDYRAVAEALRVQIVWWDTGLIRPEHHVDRAYLCGAAGSLAIVRSAIRHLIDAALLEFASPKPSANSAREWISGQINFFKTRTIQRRKSLSLFDDAIWFLIIGSVGMAIALVPLTLVLDEKNWVVSIFTRIDQYLLRTQSGVFSWLMAFAPLLVAIVLFYVARLIWHFSRTRNRGPQRRLLDILNMSIGTTAGFLVSISIYILVADPNYLAGILSQFGMHHIHACADSFESQRQACIHHIAHNLVASFMIVFLSIAGALRFYTERLALEAELHSYREALGVFKRAEDELNKPGTGNSAAKIARREKIILELGRHALKENESWIRAHRVRPLEPHV